MVKVLETETIQQRFIRAKELGKYMDCSTTTVWWLTKNKKIFQSQKSYHHRLQSGTSIK